LKNIEWETDEAVQYADDLYEKIAYLTIQNSMELAKEKGTYKAYKGSKWDTGEYFDNKGYTDEEWSRLKREVQENGMRNGYLMAVAANSWTSMIAGSTASIDPIFNVLYHEEKKDFKIPV